MRCCCAAAPVAEPELQATTCRNAPLPARHVQPRAQQLGWPGQLFRAATGPRQRHRIQPAAARAADAADWRIQPASYAAAGGTAACAAPIRQQRRQPSQQRGSAATPAPWHATPWLCCSISSGSSQWHLWLTDPPMLSSWGKDEHLWRSAAWHVIVSCKHA
jgi:hypothetical protein